MIFESVYSESVLCSGSLLIYLSVRSVPVYHLSCDLKLCLL